MKRSPRRLVAAALLAGVPASAVLFASGAASASSTGAAFTRPPIMLPYNLFVDSATNSTTAFSCGDTIDIYGFDFTGATSVDFGGVPAASYSVVSPLEITAVAADGTPATGKVTVTGPGGTSTSYFAFTASNCTAPSGGGGGTGSGTSTGGV